MRSSSVRSLIKKGLILTVVAATIFLVINPHSHSSQKRHVYIHQWSARAVWDFVADINHLKITNPFLEEFDIVLDGGVYPDWHYSALLKENIPVIGKVESEAECLVKTLEKKYQIITMYKHCKFLLCVRVNSTLIFTSEGSGTAITEDLRISFPKALIWFFDAPVYMESHLKRIDIIKSHLEENVLPQENNVKQ